MNGDQLRALLIEWKISRSMFVDALALIGYRVEAGHVTRGRDRVPETAIRLIEEWRADPNKRPVAHKRPAVYPIRRQA